MDGKVTTMIGRRSVLRIIVSLNALSVERVELFSMQPKDMVLNELVQKLRSGQNAFFSQPFSYSWWLRGGEPGSPSDKLTLEGDRGSVQGIYIRTRFDPKREPPFASETFRGAIDVDCASSVLLCLFESSLFRERLVEENDRGNRDLRQETWKFDRDGIHLSKTLFEPFPESIEALRETSRDLEDRLARVDAS